MRGEAVGFARHDMFVKRHGDAIAVRATGDRYELGAIGKPVVFEPGPTLFLPNAPRRVRPATDSLQRRAVIRGSGSPRDVFHGGTVRGSARLGAMAWRLPRGRDSRTVASHRIEPLGAAVGESAR
ncbi:hypothetical protein [Nocardia sp. NPDC004260]